MLSFPMSVTCQHTLKYITVHILHYITQTEHDTVYIYTSLNI